MRLQSKLGVLSVISQRLHKKAKVIKKVEKSGLKKGPQAKDIVSEAANYYVNRIKNATAEIGKIGARRIATGMTIMTHCHSSAAERV